MLKDSAGAAIVFPKVVAANQSLLTDVIDGRGYFGLQFMMRDDSPARLRAFFRQVSISDEATDLCEADAPSNNAANTSEQVLLTTPARNAWIIDTTIDPIDMALLGRECLSLFRLRFGCATNGQPVTIKSIDSMILNMR